MKKSLTEKAVWNTLPLFQKKGDSEQVHEEIEQ
jgi:hypothetical protein